MARYPTLRLCLEPALLKSAELGTHNFINLIVETAKNSHFRVEYCPATEAELFKPVSQDVFTLTHMKQPPSGQGLVFRRVYSYPFWQIDKTAERWNWDLAKARFDPNETPEKEAQRFAGYWRKRLFGDVPDEGQRPGYIFVPLQGKLGIHRSFQTCSPLEMLRQTLAHCGSRNVVATLHPNEEYTNADLAGLELLEKRYPQLTVSQGDMEARLRDCDFVVTQNSAAAFFGYFFRKAALLFADIDFHHIAVKADLTNLRDSFGQVAHARPEYDRYLWWFWQHQSINAGKDDAISKIASRLQRFGWPMQ